MDIERFGELYYVVAVEKSCAGTFYGYPYHASTTRLNYRAHSYYLPTSGVSRSSESPASTQSNVSVGYSNFF